MPKLGELAKKVRSKNAGPFWLTIDIFFAAQENYKFVCKKLSNKEIASLFAIDICSIKRFQIDELGVLKISFPRPFVQGSIFDRDMHGASYANLLIETDLF